MRRMLIAVLFLAALAGPLASRPEPEEPQALKPVVESYYKLAPGKAEDWLALYTKEHLPILRERQKRGEIEGILIYRPFLHQGGPAWDYKVILVYRDFDALGDRTSFDAIERRLYPNWEAHRRAEQRRWEITEHHWDDIMTEVKPD